MAGDRTSDRAAAHATAVTAHAAEGVTASKRVGGCEKDLYLRLISQKLAIALIIWLDR